MSGFLIQVLPEKRQGRGRYYKPRSCGYTNSAMRAGVYSADAAALAVRGLAFKLEVVPDPLEREPGEVFHYEWSNDDPEVDAYRFGLARGAALGSPKAASLMDSAVAAETVAFDASDLYPEEQQPTLLDQCRELLQRHRGDRAPCVECGAVGDCAAGCDLDDLLLKLPSKEERSRSPSAIETQE